TRCSKQRKLQKPRRRTKRTRPSGGAGTHTPSSRGSFDPNLGFTEDPNPASGSNRGNAPNPGTQEDPASNLGTQSELVLNPDSQGEHSSNPDKYGEPAPNLGSPERSSNDQTPVS
ncbi:14196_t:CDS:2, partial [Racocetra fulgida]